MLLLLVEVVEDVVEDKVVAASVVLERDFVFFLVLLNSSKKRVCPDASDDDDDDEDFDGARGLADVRLTLSGGLMLSSAEDKAFFVDAASVGDDAEGFTVRYFRIESWGGEEEAAAFLLLFEPVALVSKDMMIWVA